MFRLCEYRNNQYVLGTFSLNVFDQKLNIRIATYSISYNGPFTVSA
jgi:hypothetical protein